MAKVKKSNLLEKQRTNYESITVEKTISNSKFNFLVGLFTLYGILINIFLYFGIEFKLADYYNPIIFIGSFIVPFIGMIISMHPNMIIKFIGYNLIVIPDGYVMAMSLHLVSPDSVIKAFISMALIVLAMMTISSLFPQIFQHLRHFLMTVTLSVLAVMIFMMITGMYFGAIHWIIVILFALWVGFDWSMAQAEPCKTLDLAMMCAIDLYLDIQNLMLNLAEIFELDLF